MKVIFPCVLLLLSSCRQEYTGPTIAEGHVVDNATGKAIPYAEVYLVADQASIGGGAPGGEDYQLTDSTGHFYFSFTPKAGYYYSIWPRAKYYSGTPQNGDIQSNQKNMNMKVGLNPAAWIKFMVINEPPIDTVKEFTIGAPFNTIQILWKDTTLFKTTLGGSKGPIIFDYYKHNKEIKIIDSIYISPLDTVEYTIKY